MYLNEDRIRAVKLYIKLGKRTAPTIRKLGYPTQNAHQNHVQAFSGRLDRQCDRTFYVKEQLKRNNPGHFLKHSPKISRHISG